jgi:biopolymer transport protein ExbD
MKRYYMDNINIAANDPSTLLRSKAGVRRVTRHNLKIDMTPMVDLGFLLISFFVITTELSRPKAMNLIMPHEGPSTPAGDSKTITFLTGAGNKLFYYYGEEKDAGIKNPVVQIPWDEKNGVGNMIGKKQLQLDHVNGGRDEMVVIIKPGKESTYKNVVDLLDEMTIHGVTRYAIVKPGDGDAQFLDKNK